MSSFTKLDNQLVKLLYIVLGNFLFFGQIVLWSCSWVSLIFFQIGFFMKASYIPRYTLTLLLSFIAFVKFKSLIKAHTTKTDVILKIKDLENDESNAIIHDFDKQYQKCAKCQAVRFRGTYHSPHHCSICNCCIERMDHHCYFVNNCIGERNHKYFFQFIINALLSAVLITTFNILELYFVYAQGMGERTFGLYFLWVIIQAFLGSVTIIGLINLIVTQMQGLALDQTLVEMKHNLGSPRIKESCIFRRPLFWWSNVKIGLKERFKSTSFIKMALLDFY